MRLSASAFVLLAVVSAAGAGAPFGRLRGEVRGEGRRPVAGAVLVATRSEAPAAIVLTATDAQGFLAIDAVPGGVWRAVVTAPGYAPETVEGLAVGGPYRAVVDVALRGGQGAPAPIAAPAGEGGPPRVAVSVVDDEGRPLAGVRVALEPVGRAAEPLRAATDAEGRAVLLPDDAGEWRLALYRAGWTRLAAPRVRWGGGTLAVAARMLPLPEGAAAPLEELLPPARLTP